MVRRKITYTSINPALFLTQALRSLEEAQKLESTAIQAQTGSAFQLYSTLVQTFQTVFGVPGPAGQERIRPLTDRHLLLQLAHVARDAREGFNRTHDALPIHVVVNIRAGYYPSPSFPADVGNAIGWLESMAALVQQGQEPVDATEIAQKGKGKVKRPVQSTIPGPSKAPVLPAIPVTASSPNPPGECLVCAETFSFSPSPSTDAAILPKRAPTAQCTHSPGICTSCLSQTISAHLEVHGAARAIPCPTVDCNATLSREDVREWATETTFARWDMLSLREMMRTDAATNPDGGLFIWCQNPYCYSGQLHPEGDAHPMVTCVRCAEKTCFTHNTMWHEGQTCKQYDRSRPIKDLLNRGVSRAAVWWNSRTCPGCFQPIIKCSDHHALLIAIYHVLVIALPLRKLLMNPGNPVSPTERTWWYAPIHWRRFTPFLRRRNPAF